MDIIDTANEHADRELELRLQAFKKNQANLTTSARDYCIDCDALIPEARKKIVAGCQRCVECQEIDDIKRRR